MPMIQGTSDVISKKNGRAERKERGGVGTGDTGCGIMLTTKYYIIAIYMSVDTMRGGGKLFF